MRTDRTYVDIHLDRIEENMRAIQRELTPGTMVIGIVKADGYGHGAVAVAQTIDRFVSGYGVATADEALQLRKHGIGKGILVLGPAARERYEELVREEIRPTIFRYEDAKELSKTACRLERTAKIHIAVDTGMGRIGLEPGEQAAETVERIAALPGIQIEGAFTHFARADEREKEFTRQQLERFSGFLALLKERGISIPIRHCSNSAGLLELREADFDAVRAGIILYGLKPSGETGMDFSVRPAMEWKSHLTYIKEVEAGTSISYGGTFLAPGPMRVATVCAGYGDGYPRSLSGKGEILVCGKRAPILGRICMDQFMVDVTDIPQAREWETVTLLGQDGDETITMEELAQKSGGFHYELPCLIGRRVPRRYLYRGEPVAFLSWPDGTYEAFREPVLRRK